MTQQHLYRYKFLNPLQHTDPSGMTADSAGVPRKRANTLLMTTERNLDSKRPDPGKDRVFDFSI